MGRAERPEERVQRVVDHVLERLRLPQRSIHRLDTQQRFPTTMNVGALRFKGVKHAFFHGSSMPGLPGRCCARVGQAIASFALVAGATESMMATVSPPLPAALRHDRNSYQYSAA